MKISFFIPTASFLAATFLFSCTMPESLTIKTSETPYEIPLGNVEVNLSEKFDSEAIQKAIGGDEEESSSDDSDKKTIYAVEFNPSGAEDAILEYLMQYDIAAQELGVTTAFSGLTIPENATEEEKNQAIDYFVEQNFETIKSTDLNSFNAKLDTGINFKSILESFAGSDEDGTDYSDIFDKIAFAGIEAYAYIASEQVSSDNAYFTGKIVVGEDESTIDATADGTYTSILADSDDTTNYPSGKFEIVETIPSLNDMKNDDGVIEKRDDFIAEGAYSVALDSEELTNYMNGTQNPDGSYTKHESLIIAYDMTPHLTFSSADELKEFLKTYDKVNINVSIILRLPLQIRITDDIEIADVLDFAGQGLDEDLLNRDEGEEFSQKKYTELIKTLALDYQFKDSTGLSIEAEIDAGTGTDENGNTASFFDSAKPFTFDGDQHTISFSTDEIERIFTYSPFIPKIALKINKTDGENFVSIKRNSVFGVYALFRMTVEGEVEVWNKNGSDDEESNE